jgi:dihydroflavonol-4-reductase
MILVTGATGFVGSHLLAELMNRGMKVRATRRASSDTGQVYEILKWYGIKPEVYSGLTEWIEADMLDPVDVEQIMDGIETVYHTAALVSFDRADSRRLVINNIGIARNIVDACLKKDIQKLIYVSSTVSLGTAPGGEEITEDYAWVNDKRQTAYSRSKYLSEMEVWRGIAEGLNAVIVNPSIILGPGDWTRSSLKIFRAVQDGLKYYTEGVTGFVDVRDVVRSMIDLAQSGISGERFILSSENLSYKEVFQMIAEALKRPPPVKLATPFLLGVVWRLDWLVSKLTGRERTITREIARASRQKSYFSSKKISETTGIQFIPVASSIENASGGFPVPGDRN